MKNNGYELRTKNCMKVGDIGVRDEELVLVVKKGNRFGILTIEEIIQQIVGEEIKFVITYDENLMNRIADVKNNGRIIITEEDME